VSSPRIVYTPRPDATLETELDVLANAYAFILRAGEARRAEEMKKGTRPGAPDARKESNGSGKVSIHN
jgi:hypothetical protein